MWSAGGPRGSGLQTPRVALHLVADGGPAESAARGDIYDVEAAVYSKQLNWSAAIAAEKEAVEQTPTVARRWQTLATLYSNTGEQEQHKQAEQRANTLLTHNP